MDGTQLIAAVNLVGVDGLGQFEIDFQINFVCRLSWSFGVMNGSGIVGRVRRSKWFESQVTVSEADEREKQS